MRKSIRLSPASSHQNTKDDSRIGAEESRFLPHGITRVKAWRDGYNVWPKSVPTTDDLSQFKYIGLHSKEFVFAISIDIDICGFQPEDANIPMPNWITTNPVSRHAHAVWVLDTIIKRDNLKQMAYLNAVSAALAARISSTNAAVKNLNATQNPAHPHWLSRVIHKTRLDLGVLAEYVLDGPSEYIHKSGFMRQEGRNSALWYDCIKVAQKHNYSHSQVIDLVARHATEIAREFCTPLPLSEIESVTRSICKYASQGYPFYARVKAATKKRQQCNPNAAAVRAKALGVSRSTYYAKRLHTIQGAVKHALSLPSDTTTKFVLDVLPSGGCFDPSEAKTSYIALTRGTLSPISPPQMEPCDT